MTSWTVDRTRRPAVAALFALFLVWSETRVAGAQDWHAALGFEDAGAWRTAPDLTALFPEDKLLAAGRTAMADLAGGATLVQDPVRTGAWALRWADHPRFPTLHTRNVPADWRPFRTLVLWIHSAVATDERVTAAVLVDNPATPWQDFRCLTFRVDWTGWKRMQWPLARFESLGTPGDWRDVGGLFFFTKIFNHQPNPYTELVLDDGSLEPDLLAAVGIEPAAADARSSRLPVSSEVPLAEPYALNHHFQEVRTPFAAAPDPIHYEPYFKAERALAGYYPRFMPGFVSVAPDGRIYLRYGAVLIQTCAADGRWQVRNLRDEVVEPYARETLGFSALGLGNKGQTDDALIRFDQAGDAYMLVYIHDPTRDWRSRTGLLLHGRDGMSDWTVYRLPYYMARFEKPAGASAQALTGPPVILLSRYHSPTTNYLLLPRKRADGTLELPEPVVVADRAIGFIPHSGEAGNVVTDNGKLVVAYGRLDVRPGYTRYDGVPAWVREYDLADGRWSRPVPVGRGGRNAYDGHNWPTIAMDSRGVYHVIINGHHDPFVYTRSLEPHSIAGWTEPVELAGGTTYAGLVIDSSDTLYAVTRCSDPGYVFRLTLHRKRPGQPWEEPRHLVIPCKPYYKIWYHKLTLDPHTDRLFLAYYAQSATLCLFRDEFDMYCYTWPDRALTMLAGGRPLPLGTCRSTPRTYAFYHVPPTEMVVLVSTDHGDSWRLAVTSDFLPPAGPRP